MVLAYFLFVVCSRILSMLLSNGLVVGFFGFEGFLVASTAEWFVALGLAEEDTLVAADSTVADIC